MPPVIGSLLANACARRAGRIAFMLGAATLLPAAFAPAASSVFGDPARLRTAPPRTYHVDHYRLALHFKAQQGEVFGDEIVSLKPLQAGFRTFYLNSADLVIDAVELLTRHEPARPLLASLEGEHLTITLDRAYAKGEQLAVRIRYHGFPRFGLFFERPDADYPNQPREIWSQGETDFNHHWFPCWDYPNDLATSEVIVTVPDGQVAVSNGRLAKFTRSAGGVAYDWVESVPHATYLTSLAIGPWQKVHQHYKRTPVDYYVPRGIDPATVRRAFGETPNMLAFYSSLFIEYPYEKYAQVTVHDFPFGGMENVTATTLGESVLQDSESAADYPATEVIAHELGQHWFGDYVQARDWAHIWLNEGFATYLPALYTWQRDGADAFRWQMLADQETAKREEEQQYRRPIVDRHYTDDGMQMFDATTHEKGAAVLDMLRYVIDGPGPSARAPDAHSRFFTALRAYLTQHARQTTETADLLATLVSATGQHLDGFFRQWIDGAGHPSYQVSAAYDAAAGAETVRIAQKQAGAGVPTVFVMPIELVFHGRQGQSVRLEVENDRREQDFQLPLAFEPLWIDFDPEGYIEKDLDFSQPVTALAAAALEDPSMAARLWAVHELSRIAAARPDTALEVLGRVLTGDPFDGVRAAAAVGLGASGQAAAAEMLRAALHDRDRVVRAAAAQALGAFSRQVEVYAALVSALRDDLSPAVRSAAAASIASSGNTAAFSLLLREHDAKPEPHLASALEAALGETKDPRATEILLDDARAPAAYRLRMSALAALATRSAALDPRQQRELIELLARTCHESYFPLQQQAEALIVSLGLVQLEGELRAEAQRAPTEWQREQLTSLIRELQSRKGKPTAKGAPHASTRPRPAMHSARMARAESDDQAE